MDDMDEILAKHFAGETNAEEEALITTWRAENTGEYNLLKNAWAVNRNVGSNINFNTAKAWDKVYKESVQTTRVIPLFKRPSIKYGMVASLILILGLIVFLKSGAGFSKEENILVFENAQDSVKSIVLPDGSTIWMNKSSKLVYESNSTEIRKMSLSGEVFFEVKKDATHPFIIACKNSTVTVLGTSFNIKSGDSSTTVSVKTGLVKFSSDHASVLLNPGEAASTSKNKISEVLKSEANYLSWKTGEFVFENTPLPEIVRSLNTYYKNRFACENSDCKLTAHFKNNSVEDIIQTVSLICTCTVENKNGKILFR